MIHTADTVSQLSELLGVVQHFNTLRVGVVAHCEGSWDSACKSPVETFILGECGMHSKTCDVQTLIKNKEKVSSYLTFSLASSKLSATK